MHQSSQWETQTQLFSPEQMYHKVQNRNETQEACACRSTPTPAPHKPINLINNKTHKAFSFGLASHTAYDALDIAKALKQWASRTETPTTALPTPYDGWIISVQRCHE